MSAQIIRIAGTLEDYDAEAHGDGPLVVAKVREDWVEIWSITHRPTGFGVADTEHRTHMFELADFDHACRFRDELLAIDHDWSVADPLITATPETRAAVRAVFAREHARRGGSLVAALRGAP